MSNELFFVTEMVAIRDKDGKQLTKYDVLDFANKVANDVKVGLHQEYVDFLCEILDAEMPKLNLDRNSEDKLFGQLIEMLSVEVKVDISKNVCYKMG